MHMQERTVYADIFLFNLQFNPDLVDNYATTPSFSCFGEPVNHQDCVLHRNNFLIASNLLLIIAFNVKTFKRKHLSWLDLTRCLAEYLYP